MTAPSGGSDADAASVLVGRRDNVVVLTMSAPGRRNAISLGMRRELASTLRAETSKDGLRVVVLTGADGTFSSGGDLSEMTGDPEVASVRIEALADATRAIIESPVPVIAAVDGDAFGGALAFAAACDLVVAAEDARFCAVFGRVGLTGDAGVHWSLPARVGPGPARALLLTGRVVRADEARRLGLVDEITPGPSLDRALALAGEMARLAPLSLRATRDILRRAPADLEETLAAEAVWQKRLLASRDFEEGRSAFFERRPPGFTGR